MAWAGMQDNMSKEQMEFKKDKLHAEVGNVGGTIVVMELECRNGKRLVENIIDIVDIGLAKEDLFSADLQIRHTGAGEIGVGERQGNLLKNGGGLVLQDGAHFRLVFMDSNKDIILFDPLGGKNQIIAVTEIYDYVSPRNENTDRAAVLELRPPSDFTML